MLGDKLEQCDGGGGRGRIGVEWGRVEWKGNPRGRGICIDLAGSFNCTAETNTIQKEKAHRSDGTI